MLLSWIILCFFFSIALLEKCVKETNRDAKQFMAKNKDQLKEKSRVLKWVDTNLMEIKAFVAVIINMGLNRKSTIDSYWITKKKSQCTPWFNHVFPYDRFFLLLKFFHLVNNDTLAKPGQPGYDPVAKFKPLVEHANRLFRHHYTPKQELSVDESLIGTKNKTQILQYLPNKHHHKWGIKLWMICEAVTGYVLGFTVYKGKRDNQEGDDRGVGQKAVTSLLTICNYLNKG